MPWERITKWYSVLIFNEFPLWFPHRNAQFLFFPSPIATFLFRPKASDDKYHPKKSRPHHISLTFASSLLLSIVCTLKAALWFIDGKRSTHTSHRSRFECAICEHQAFLCTEWFASCHRNKVNTLLKWAKWATLFTKGFFFTSISRFVWFCVPLGWVCECNLVSMQVIFCSKNFTLLSFFFAFMCKHKEKVKKTKITHDS